MSKRNLVAFVLALGVAPAVVAARPKPGAVKRDEGATANVREHLLALPLNFEPNRGQAASPVDFLSRGPGYTLMLAPGEVVLNLHRPQPPAAGASAPLSGDASVDSLHMRLLGASSEAHRLGLDPQPGVVSYFIGSDPKRWRAGIPTYGKIAYSQVYPGVDLVFYGNQRRLEYDFVVAPGADPGRIDMDFSGAQPKLDRTGNVLLSLAGQTVVLGKPALYQGEGANRKPVDGGYALEGARVRLRVGPYDRSQPLVIDPVISYLTYLGGKTGINGNVAITSISCRPNACPGGFSDQEAQGIAVDSSGNVYVTGQTWAVDFPTQNPFQPADKSASQWTAYVTKLNPTGTGLVYSTYLGGSGNDEADAIAIDASGSAYVIGNTYSGDFPTTPSAYISKCPYQGGGITYCQSNGGSFLTKLSPDGQSLVYSTYVTTLGNTGMLRTVAVDSQGRAYVVGDNTNYGNSSSPSNPPGLFFPTTPNALLPSSLVDQAVYPHTFNPGMADLAVFSADGSSIVYATLYGDANPSAHGGYGDQTANWTRATGVTVDPAGNFYLAGITADPNIPVTASAFQGKYIAFTTAYRSYVAKFSSVDSAKGPGLVYGTYLGAMNTNLNASDEIRGIVADASGSAYVTGLTGNPGFPTTSGAYDPGPCGALSGGNCGHGAFLTKLTPDGSALAWSTLVSYSYPVAGTGYNGVQQILPPRLDAWGNIYVEVQSSLGYPTVNPVQTFTDWNGKLGITEFDPTGSKILFSTLLGGATGQDQYGASNQYPGGLDVDPLGNIYVAGMTTGGDLPATVGAFEPNFPLTSDNWTGFIAKIGTGVVPVAALSAGAASVAAAAGSGAITVTAAAGAAWTAVSDASWITITSGASGTGNGAVTFSIAANTGAARSGIIIIGGTEFTVYQEGASSVGLSFAGSMAQVASGGGWDTTLTLVNLGSTQAEARLNFSGDDGSAPWLPFTFPQQSATATTLGATFDQTLAGNASLIFDTTGPQANAEGSAQLLTSGDMNGFAIFTYTPNGQAAVAPLETRNAGSYLLPFDDTGSLSTGLAVANLASSAANVNVVIRNDSGAQIGAGTISLPAAGHTSFMLNSPPAGVPAISAGRGTVEFDTPASGRISVLGLRANPIPNTSGFAVTSLPVLAGVAPSGGVMSQIVSGGGWQTTLTLVNTGVAAATANVNFFGDSGVALSLPLNFPQTGASTTAGSVSQSIPAGGSLIIAVEDTGSATSTEGSAVLSTTGNIGGFAIFRFNPTGQEAAVPAQAVNASAYVLAFDNTGSLSTGLAIANVASQAASVNVVLRNDAGAQIGTGLINLPAHGHTSFMLTDTSNGGWAFTAGVRGTVEFVTPAGGQIAPLGLRVATIPGGFTITTIPVMTP